MAVASTFFLGWGSFVEAGSLIFAAIVQPRSVRLGAWLMLVSSLLLTLVAFFPATVAWDGLTHLASIHDRNRMAISSWCLTLTLLVLWCDVTVAIALVRRTLRRSAIPPRSGSLDYTIWIVAVLLTGYSTHAVLANIRAYRLNGGSENVAFVLIIAAVVLFFDAALITERVRRHTSTQ